MTKIPHILYHGTTFLRWAMIKHDGMMKASMPRYFRCDKSNTMGYLYFTDNLEEATFCGLNTYLVDQRMEQTEFKQKALYKLVPYSQNIVIVGVKTSKLRQNFELDPELETVKMPKLELLMKAFKAPTEQIPEWMTESIWYRHKGDIPIKHLIPSKIAPVDQFGRTRDVMDKIMDEQELAEIGLKP